MLSQPDRLPPPGRPAAPPLEHPAPFRLDRPPTPPPSPFVRDFASIDGLAAAVRYLIIGSIGISLVIAALEAYLIRVLDRSPLFGGLPVTGARVYDMTGLLILLDLLLVISAGICVMILFKRMMDNGAALNPGSSTYKSHWAITGWIVPFLSLVRPFQVVRQIWETSRSGDFDRDRRPLPVVSRVWWGLFLVSNTISFSAPTAPWDGTATIDDFVDEAIGQLIISLIQSASGVAFLVLLASLVPQHRLAIRAAEHPDHRW